MQTGSTAEDVLRSLLTTAEGQADPYPLYHRLRANGVLHRSQLDGIWYASGFGVCREVLLDPRFGPRAGSVARRFGMSEAQDRRSRERARRPSMINANPPEHTRLRHAARSPFAPRAIEQLRSRVIALVDERLDAIARHGEADVMAELAFRLPVTVIGELLGVPVADREHLRPLVWSVMTADRPGATDAEVDQADQAADSIDRYFLDMIPECRTRPGPDLFTELVAACDQGNLEEQELLATVTLLFIAGFLTTTNLIGNGLLALLRHPGELARLAADPTLVPSAVEEMLRYDSPVQSRPRVALEAAQVGGQTLEEGDTVMVLLGAANRDPVRFPDPDRFDVTRSECQPLSFGWGVHHCLGAGLARLEGQVVFTRILQRFECLELLDEDPPRAPGFLGRRLARLPVRFRPRERLVEIPLAGDRRAPTRV